MVPVSYTHLDVYKRQVQNRAWLDFRLGEFSSQKVEKLEPVLLDILRLGAYQILFLDRVPDSAAVNEAVNQAKAHKMARAAGLVNAVLRKLSAHKDQLPGLPEHAADRLSLLYSHPRWLTERLLELVGEEESEAFLREDNGTPPVYVQTNPPVSYTHLDVYKRQVKTSVVEPRQW